MSIQCRILNNANKYLDTFKEIMIMKIQIKEMKNFLALTSLKYLERKKNQSQLKKIPRELQKPLWFKINKAKF